MNIYWLEQDRSQVPSDDAWLSDAEAIRASAMQVPKRHADWRLGRWTAKRALAIHLGLSQHHSALRNIELKPAFSGAPVAFVSDARAPLNISLTHSAARAMVALSPPNVPLGCDLERVEPRIAAFAADYFTRSEQDLVQHAPPDQRDAVLTLLWSLKESALKALQEGLRADTRSVEVTGDFSSVQIVDATDRWNHARMDTLTGESFHCLWRCEGALVRTIACAEPFHAVNLMPQSVAAASDSLFAVISGA